MRAFVCPSCGAPLEAAAEARTIHCQFCDRDFEREDVSKPRAAEPRHSPAPWMLVAPIVAVVVLGVALLAVLRFKSAEPHAVAQPVVAAPPPAPAPPPPTAEPAPAAAAVEVPTPTAEKVATTTTADLESGPFTLTWNGKVQSSMDPQPHVGAPCTITGTFSAKPLGNARCDHLVVQCAGKVYYDSAKKLEGMSMSSFGLGEEPVAGEVRAFRYAMKYKDVGTRSGERAQITLDTNNEMLEAFRDELPSYRVKVKIDKLSPVRRGRPLLARSVPAFEEVVTKKAKVASKTGSPPFAGNACTMVISPAFATKTTCRVTLTCGGKVVYGSGTTGFAECVLANGAPSSFVDPYPTPQGGDPELQADLVAKTAVLSDTTAGGATYSVRFTLE